MRVFDHLRYAVRARLEPRDTEAERRNHAASDLLHTVLHDVLQLQGIPTDWIGCEVYTGSKTVHWRLQLLHWDPKLVVHVPAIEDALRRHLLGVDAESRDWLSSITWQFAMPDRSACPALPRTGSWVERRRVPGERLQGVDAARENLNRLLAQIEPERRIEQVDIPLDIQA